MLFVFFEYPFFSERFSRNYRLILSLRCLIFKVLSSLTSVRELFYSITSNPVCQVLFSSFLRFFHLTFRPIWNSFQNRAWLSNLFVLSAGLLRDSLIILSHPHANVKPFFAFFRDFFIFDALHIFIHLSISNLPTAFHICSPFSTSFHLILHRNILFWSYSMIYRERGWRVSAAHGSVTFKNFGE